VTRAVQLPHLMQQNGFMTWLRAQQALGSQAGFTANDLDCIWLDYKRRRLMLIETKRYRGAVKFQQRETLALLHRALRAGMPDGWTYCGTHLIQFEHTSPDDGRIWLDGREIDRETLVRFLAFEAI
jgi:hypothetical protein